MIDAFMSLPEPQQAIVYSNTHQTVAMDGKPIFEFIRYRVLPDKTATVSMKTFSAKTHEEIGKGTAFKCGLGEGLSFAYQPSN
ncbi:VirK protein [compost metagenome]